jgi:hypothetical protein
VWRTTAAVPVSPSTGGSTSLCARHWRQQPQQQLSQQKPPSGIFACIFHRIDSSVASITNCIHSSVASITNCIHSSIACILNCIHSSIACITHYIHSSLACFRDWTGDCTADCTAD